MARMTQMMTTRSGMAANAHGMIMKRAFIDLSLSSALPGVVVVIVVVV